MSKIIVITGAGLGLGRALARRFASEGEQVVLLGRTFSKVEAAAKEIGDNALPIACDVSSPGAVKEAFAEVARKHGRIDVLINNAAVFEPFLVAEASDAQIIDTIMSNLCGAILCARAAIPLMKRGSHIINVSSEAVDNQLPHMLVYQTSKAGLERFTLGLQRELEPSGIRVSGVRAGAMFEVGKVFNADPAALMRFHQAALAAGYNLREKPLSQFTSVTQVFRTLIDLPDDLHALNISLLARKA
jgi:meso-butanediol dehydrogenase / (S,S)-butanediol dehydrogenase / diacetyl reductase